MLFSFNSPLNVSLPKREEILLGVLVVYGVEISLVAKNE